jgi:GT2 family glycosyltransferase
MNMKYLFSVIIPLYRINHNFVDGLGKFRNLTLKKIEVIIVSDIAWKIPGDLGFPIKIYQTGEKDTGPAEKRDIGIKHARGRYCAFIDDDAYPDPQWLNNTLITFQSETSVVAVGGPGITPPDDPYLSLISGAVLTSNCTSGKLRHRFISHGKIRNIVDWPAYNLIVKTETLKKVGGFGSTFYGGEDTFLCMKLLKYGNIVYNPDVKVFHHRRPAGLPFLKQIFNVGLHRGYFFRKYPETSRSLIYFLPGLLTIGLLCSVILVLINVEIKSYIYSIYLIILGISFISIPLDQPIIVKIPASIMIIFTHIAYATGFLKGLLIKKLDR